MKNECKQKGSGKIILFTAPSGSGKTTVVRHILRKYECLDFSVSATTRKRRPHEEEGRDYYFMSKDEFKDKRKRRKFVEWEEVYDEYYGTLKSEVERIWDSGKHIVFDIEVKGATNIKKKYGNQVLAIFIKVPTLEILIERLRNRKTEDDKMLRKRIRRIKRELTYEQTFDRVLINDHLEDTLAQAEKMVEEFIFTQ